MQWMIWLGSLLTLSGLAMLGYCILSAMKLRNADLDDTAKRDRLQKLVAWNMGALGLSGLGLMCVIVGLALG